MTGQGHQKQGTIPHPLVQVWFCRLPAEQDLGVPPNTDIPNGPQARPGCAIAMDMAGHSRLGNLGAKPSTPYLRGGSAPRDPR